MTHSIAGVGDSTLEQAPTFPSTDYVALGVTAGACLIAIGLAIGPGWAPHGRVIRYDASLAIYAVTFMGVAWYTYYQRRTLLAQENALRYTRWQYRDERGQERQLRENQRKTRTSNLSTAVLAELQPLAARLRGLRGTTPYSHHDPFKHPLVTDALQHVELFDSETVLRLADVSGRLHEVQELVGNHGMEREKLAVAAARVHHLQVTTGNANEIRVAEQERGRYQERIAQIELVIQVIGTDAHNSLAELVKHLRHAGGVMPRPLPTAPVMEGQLSALAPDPFA